MYLVQVSMTKYRSAYTYMFMIYKNETSCMIDWREKDVKLLIKE